jgi:hypothetical protein
VRSRSRSASTEAETDHRCAHQMTEKSYQVRRMQLDLADANRLGKWASLWADLLHVDMVLAARAELPKTAMAAFTRRAFWESAIVSYGRMEASTKKRKLAHEALLRTARGDRGIEFHKILMSWRRPREAWDRAAQSGLTRWLAVLLPWPSSKSMRARDQADRSPRSAP